MPYRLHTHLLVVLAPGSAQGKLRGGRVFPDIAEMPVPIGYKLFGFGQCSVSGPKQRRKESSYLIQSGLHSLPKVGLMLSKMR